MVVKLLKDESGATALEYAMLVAVLAVAVIVGVNGIGGQTTEIWNNVDTEVTAS